MSEDGRYRVCRCQCGATKRVRIDHLKSGATISCGCIGRTNAANAIRTHGMSHTRTFKIWIGMLDRCKNDRQGHWGKRGIIVCDQWRDSFQQFFNDLGHPPTNSHSIDRIDVNGNYEPSNCRWATRKEQARNTTQNTVLELNGVRATIAEWSEKTGIKPATICQRLAQGQTTTIALTATVRPWRLNAPWKDEGLSRSEWYRRRKP